MSFQTFIFFQVGSDIFSVFGLSNRTNNLVESQNKQLKRILGINSNVWIFLRKYKKNHFHSKNYIFSFHYAVNLQKYAVDQKIEHNILMVEGEKHKFCERSYMIQRAQTPFLEKYFSWLNYCHGKISFQKIRYFPRER